MNILSRNLLRLEGEKTSGAPPFGYFERMLALRYMRSRRHRFLPSAIAGFSVTGIAVGVMALIVVMSVMNGMGSELMAKIIGVNGHFFLQSIETPMSDFKNTTATLEKFPGVDMAIPMVESAAGHFLPDPADRRPGARDRRIRFKRLPGIVGNINRARWRGSIQSGGIAIGQRLADNLGVRVGDQGALLTAKGAQTPFGVTPRIKSYPVTAIFQFGLSDFDQLFVFLPLEEAQAFFNKPGEVSVIEGFVRLPMTWIACAQESMKPSRTSSC